MIIFYCIYTQISTWIRGFPCKVKEKFEKSIELFLNCERNKFEFVLTYLCGGGRPTRDLHYISSCAPLPVYNELHCRLCIEGQFSFLFKSQVINFTLQCELGVVKVHRNVSKRYRRAFFQGIVKEGSPGRKKIAFPPSHKPWIGLYCRLVFSTFWEKPLR